VAALRCLLRHWRSHRPYVNKTRACFALLVRSLEPTWLLLRLSRAVLLAARARCLLLTCACSLLRVALSPRSAKTGLPASPPCLARTRGLTGDSVLCVFCRAMALLDLQRRRRPDDHHRNAQPHPPAVSFSSVEILLHILRGVQFVCFTLLPLSALSAVLLARCPLLLRYCPRPPTATLVLPVLVRKPNRVFSLLLVPQPKVQHPGLRVRGLHVLLVVHVLLRRAGGQTLSSSLLSAYFASARVAGCIRCATGVVSHSASVCVCAGSPRRPLDRQDAAKLKRASERCPGSSVVTRCVLHLSTSCSHAVARLFNALCCMRVGVQLVRFRSSFQALPWRSLSTNRFGLVLSVF
jgi:hypothetical protein